MIVVGLLAALLILMIGMLLISSPDIARYLRIRRM